QPVAGVAIGYKRAEEIRAAAVGRVRRLVLVDGRPEAIVQRGDGVLVTSAVGRRENDTTSTQAITSEDLQSLGIVSATDMLAQLPSNAGDAPFGSDADRIRDSIARPSGVAFVNSNPAGETDSAGTFRVELPAGGTYVITARIESPGRRDYG